MIPALPPFLAQWLIPSDQLELRRQIKLSRQIRSAAARKGQSTKIRNLRAATDQLVARGLL